MLTGFHSAINLQQHDNKRPRHALGLNPSQDYHAQSNVQVNGIGKISHPHPFKTPELIWIKIQIIMFTKIVDVQNLVKIELYCFYACILLTV